jgi:uncharacterized protein (TIGR02001 family)
MINLIKWNDAMNVVMKHIVTILILFTYGVNAQAFSLGGPASIWSSFLGSRLFASSSPSTSSVPLSSASKVSPADQSFPFPEGMKKAPTVLSIHIAEAITKVIPLLVTPKLLAMIQAKTVVQEATSLPMASFQPVAPPSNTNFIVNNSDGVEKTSATYGKPITSSQNSNAVPQELLHRPFSGTFDISSLYVFRGISRSGNSPAFQGDFTYTFPKPGIYFKVWGSNVDLMSMQGQQATVEADTVAGIKNKIGQHLAYDLAMVRYNFPKASGLNYNEFVSLLTYRIFTLTLGYSSNAFNSHTNGLYYSGSFDLPIPERFAFQYTDVALIGNYGHYNLSEVNGLRSYSDFMLGIKKSIQRYTLQFVWLGTNGEANQEGLDANRLVATVFANF